jgi:hypothetical protein
MWVAIRRTNSARLSLVRNTSNTVAAPATRDVTTGSPVPEGWFDEEVGYIGETLASTCIRTKAHRE